MLGEDRCVRGTVSSVGLHRSAVRQSPGGHLTGGPARRASTIPAAQDMRPRAMHRYALSSTRMTVEAPTPGLHLRPNNWMGRYRLDLLAPSASSRMRRSTSERQPLRSDRCPYFASTSLSACAPNWRLVPTGKRGIRARGASSPGFRSAEGARKANAGPLQLGHQLGRILREQAALPFGETTDNRRPFQRPHGDFGAQHLPIAACAEDDDSSAVRDHVELPKRTAATAGGLTCKPSGLCDLHDREELSSFHSPAVTVDLEWKVSLARWRLSAALSA